MENLWTPDGQHVYEAPNARSLNILPLGSFTHLSRLSAACMLRKSGAIFERE